MTPANLAAEYVYDLHNDAEFVARMAGDARQALLSGDCERAAGLLRGAASHASLVQMRFNDALAQVEKAAGGTT